MAHHHGTPGRTLVHRVVGLVLVPVAVGFFVYLMLLVLGATNPLFRAIAPLGGLVAGAAVLRSRSFENEFVAKARGAIGENAVGRALHGLPAGWRVFHDVQLEGENVDHVVVGRRGVFSIEVKNYSGRVKVAPSGLYTHGQRNDKVVRQALRQAHRLRDTLGVEVQPVLVFARRDVGVARVGTLPVMDDFTLVPWLLRQDGRELDLETRVRLQTRLATLVAGWRPPPTSPVPTLAPAANPLPVRTSTSHPLQVFWVPSLPTSGALGLTFAPGKRGPSGLGYRWARDLGTDLPRLRETHRADVIVSLMEHHEFAMLEVPDLLERAEAVGLEVHHFPISEASVPAGDQAPAFGALVAGVRSELDAGKRVAVQCSDGIGRAGLVAAVVATTYGDSASTAIARVRQVQPRAMELPDQVSYLQSVAAALEPTRILRPTT